MWIGPTHPFSPKGAIICTPPFRSASAERPGKLKPEVYISLVGSCSWVRPLNFRMNQALSLKQR